MFSVKKIKIVSLFSLVMIVLSFNLILAQNSSQKSISVIFPWFSDHDAPGKFISNKIEELLSAKGYKNDNLASFAIIVIPITIPESKKLIITYLFANSLPDGIMKFNKENETAFLNVANKQDLPKEGKVIREYLTQERLIDYRRINFATYCNSIITDDSKLESDLNIIVDQVISSVKRNN